MGSQPNSRARAWVMLLVCLSGVHAAQAQDAGPLLSGSWTIDRAASEFPRELGFSADFLGEPPPSAGLGGGGRRGMPPTGRTGVFAARRETQEDSTRVLRLTDEVRNPTGHLTIVDTISQVAITNEMGRTMTFHANGREESMEVVGISTTVVATRDGGSLVVTFKASPGRDLRYIYSRVGEPARLMVEVQFLERAGGGDRVRRVYRPASEAAPVPAAATSSTARAETAPGSAPTAPGPSSQPAGDGQAFDQRPGAEFRGLRTLGVVVEDLSAQAGPCGLTQAALESAIAKRWTDAGFTVRRNTDDDTYLYIEVTTSSTPGGPCVSRYDATLYSHAVARLSYGTQPALVQVSLLHKGGLAGGGAAAHADSVTRGLTGFVDQFITRIRDANR